MILCDESIRVALVTIHVPLLRVPSLIDKKRVLDHIKLFNQSLKRDFGFTSPKLAVLGLNPHAGESGNIGREELEEIIPAIEVAKFNGLSVSGPFPADGFFAHGDYKNFDGILAMYHDQGLIPLKLLARGAGVNFTAGLPIVRTSPDHGTGFSIAGKNLADEMSVMNAIRLAENVVGRSRRR
jgi:4-hydroxythreonine-4-phosphate dehydrogenase